MKRGIVLVSEAYVDQFLGTLSYHFPEMFKVVEVGSPESHGNVKIKRITLESDKFTEVKEGTPPPQYDLAVTQEDGEMKVKVSEPHFEGSK